MNSRLEPFFTLGVVALAICMSGCNKGDKGTAGSSTALSAGALDHCVVGTWRSAEATLNVQSVHASGGANVEMKIESSGACVIDFTRMSVISAIAKPVNFDFHYIGKATAVLKTPSAGVITAAQSDYSGLRAFATVQMPGRGAMPLLTNVPVSSMAPAAGAKASPSGSTQGIDSSPVMSADSYACSDTLLTLTSSIAHTQWTFSRIAQ